MDNSRIQKLARRLSKQETVTTFGRRSDTETSELISRQESQSTGPGCKSPRIAESSGLPSPRRLAYETAAVEPFPASAAPGTENDSDSDDDQAFLLSYYKSNGLKAFDSNDFERAETLLTKALFVASGDTKKLDAATNLSCMNICISLHRTKRHLNKHDEAGIILAQACRFIKKEDTRLRGFIDLESVSFYLEQGKISEAEECCGKGLRSVKRRLKSKGKGAGEDAEDEEQYAGFLAAKAAIADAKGEADEAEAYRALLKERWKGENLPTSISRVKISDLGPPTTTAESGSDARTDTRTDARTDARTEGKQQLTEEVRQFIMELIDADDLIGLKEIFSGAAAADINDGRDSEYTFLHYAVKFATKSILANLPAEMDVVHYLVHLGADVKALNKAGMTPADILFDWEAPDEQVHIPPYEMAPKDSKFRRAFHALYCYGGVDVRRHVPLELSGTKKKVAAPLLHAALHLRLPKLACTIMTVGADFREVYAGRTPMDLAVAFGFTVVIIALTKKGVEFTQADYERDGSLMCQAAEKKQYKFLKWLLDNNKGGVTNGDHRGWTPLHYATYNRDVDMMELLMTHGADPYATAGRHSDITPCKIVKNSWGRYPEDKSKLRATRAGALFFK